MITISSRRLALCVAFAPAALGAQSLARRIDDVRDGTVQLVEVSKDGKMKSLGKAAVGKAPKRVAFVPDSK